MPIPLLLWGAGALVVAASAGRGKAASPTAQIAPGRAPASAPGPVQSAVSTSAVAPVLGPLASIPKPSKPDALARLRAVAASSTPWINIAISVHDPGGDSHHFMVFRETDIIVDPVLANPDNFGLMPDGVTINPDWLGGGGNALIAMGYLPTARRANSHRFWPWETANDKATYVSMRLLSDTELLGVRRLTDNGWVRAYLWKKRADIWVPSGLVDKRWPLQSGWSQALAPTLFLVGGTVAAVSGPMAAATFMVEQADPKVGSFLGDANQVLSAVM